MVEPGLPEVFVLSDKKLLSCLKKRDLLNSAKADKSELIESADRYLHEGRLSDAIDFFEQAEHVDGLAGLRDQCVSEGDYFLFLRIARILADSPSAEEWTNLGDKALALGKLLFARSAYRMADSQEKVTQVEKLLQPQNQEKAGDKDMLH
jgi:hypothetical protein